MTARYFEDFAVGQTFRSGRLRIDAEQITSFAAAFDPQPFHLDEAAARDTIFRVLAASGWHTAAVTMRLLVESDLTPAGGIVGAGIEACRWPWPVRPGDELRVESEVLEVRPSQSHPDQGLLKVRTTTLEVITIYGILRLSSQEAPPMAHLQYTDVQNRPTEFLDLTSLTLDEFQLLVAPFETAFQAHMAAWRLDGKPRTARQFAVYKNCPLPTPEDRLFFILTYLKTYSLQVVQGRLFGMRQSKANQWIHVLLPALLAALRTLGDAPARSLAVLAHRLGVTEADAASVVSSLEEEPAPVAMPDFPLLPMTGRNDALSAPKTLLNRPRVIAARKKTIRSKMSCWSTPCSLYL